MPCATVELPVPLRRFVGSVPEVEAEGEDVSGVMRSLRTLHPELGRGLLDADGRPRRFVRLYLNEVEVVPPGGFATPIEDGDRLTILVAMAGG